MEQKNKLPTGLLKVHAYVHIIPYVMYCLRKFSLIRTKKEKALTNKTKTSFQNNPLGFKRSFLLEVNKIISHKAFM